MKKTNPLITSILLAVICASIGCVEYDLAMRSEILSSIFASILGLFVLLLVVLFRAPEGYENEDGFHVSVVAAGAPHIFALVGFPS